MRNAELTTYEEDELEFERCLYAARNNSYKWVKGKAERRDVEGWFESLDASEAE